MGLHAMDRLHILIVIRDISISVNHLYLVLIIKGEKILEGNKFRDSKSVNKLISIEFVCYGIMLRGIPIGVNVYERKDVGETLKIKIDRQAENGL